MFSRIYHFLKGPNPLHPSVWEGRLPSLSFRRLADTDTDGCLELYRLNEPGRFPPDTVGMYEKSIREQTSYFVVAEQEHQIIASGGLSYFGRENIAVFCFGLVHPDHQDKGLGTALFLARLALLNPKRRTYRVVIAAVEKSIGFYERFGFRKATPWKDLHNEKHPSGYLDVTAREIRQCRALLREHRIIVPDDEDRIPFRKAPQPEAYQLLCHSCGETIEATDDFCKKCGYRLW